MSKAKRFFLVDPKGGLTLLRNRAARTDTDTDTTAEPIEPAKRSGVYSSIREPETKPVVDDVFGDAERPTRRVPAIKAS
jgi:hypothetical protein